MTQRLGLALSILREKNRESLKEEDLVLSLNLHKTCDLQYRSAGSDYEFSC
jgi:hypothetical protein